MFSIFGNKVRGSNVSIQSSGGIITINGKTYSGNSVQVDGDKVIVDGLCRKGI